MSAVPYPEAHEDSFGPCG